VSAIVDKRAAFTYYTDGQLKKIERFTSSGGEPFSATDYMPLAGIGWLGSIEHDFDTSSADYTYQYDAAGRIRDLTVDHSNAAYDSTHDFGYDATHQLTSADHDDQTDETYLYDDNGNRVTVDGSASYTTGDDNRLLSDGTYRFTYDKEGNRTLRFVDVNENDVLDSGDTGITQYTWDHRNRLTNVASFADYAAYSGQQADEIYEFTYDYLDRRIRKSVDSDGNGTPESYAYRIHRGDELALEITDQDGLAGGTYSPALAHRYMYGQAVDHILAVEDSAGDVLWGLADHEGTIRDVIDSTGNLDNHRDYDAFGRLVDGAITDDFNLAFTGRPWDDDIELYDYRARLYDPEVGRFASEDPSGFATGDMNLYRYANNSPVMYVDPSGLGYTGFDGSSSFTTFGSVVDSVNQNALRREIAHTMSTATSGPVQNVRPPSIHELLSGGPLELPSTPSTNWTEAYLSDLTDEVFDPFVEAGPTAQRMRVVDERTSYSPLVAIHDTNVGKAVFAADGTVYVRGMPYFGDFEIMRHDPDRSLPRFLQGSATLLQGGTTDFIAHVDNLLIGIANTGMAAINELASMSNYGQPVFTDGIPYVDAPQWSEDLFAPEPDWVRRTNRFLGETTTGLALGEVVASYGAAQGTVGPATTATKGPLGKTTEWWYRGVENDPAWRALPLKDKVYYEIGQKTLPSSELAPYVGLDPVARGRALVESKGWVRALLPQGSGFRLGIGETFNSGPTPLVRWAVPRATGAGAAGGATYYFLNTQEKK